MFPGMNTVNSFLQKHFFPSFNKTGNLQVFALYLPRCLCLEYAYYKNPPKECRQGINYVMN